jgi:hypothetical protein
MGHVVQSGASGARNIVALLLMLRWDWFAFKRKRTGRHYNELAFLHSVGSVVHSGASGARNVNALFFMLR